MTLRDRSATLISPALKPSPSRAAGRYWGAPEGHGAPHSSAMPSVSSSLTMDIVREPRRENLQMEIPSARIMVSGAVQALSVSRELSTSADAGIRGPRPAKRSYPYTRRMLKMNAFAAATLFVAAAGLAIVGIDQVAYAAMIGGVGFTSLAGTMAFRLLRLSLKNDRI